MFGSQNPSSQSPDHQNDHHNITIFISEIFIRAGATLCLLLGLLTFAQLQGLIDAHRLRSECSTIDLEEIMKMKDES